MDPFEEQIERLRDQYSGPQLQHRIPGTFTDPFDYFHQVARHLRQAGVPVELAHFDYDGADCVDAQIWLDGGHTLHWSPDHPWRTGWYLVRPHSPDRVGARIARTVKPTPLRVVDGVRAALTDR